MWCGKKLLSLSRIFVVILCFIAVVDVWVDASVSIVILLIWTICSFVDIACPSVVVDFADSVRVDESEVVSCDILCHEDELLVSLFV